jgi:phosphonate degradation associated HDIG domain protein
MNRIETLFHSWGDIQYSGEGVSQLEHALQTAMLALEAEASTELITAALLHDIGHLLNKKGETPSAHGIDDQHQFFAAHFLKEIFPASVCSPIRLHVDAKRALCALDHAYYEKLSEDSKRSLTLQGGIFNDSQLDTFLNTPYSKEAIELRRWDDLAKISGKKTLSLHYFLDCASTIMLERH